MSELEQTIEELEQEVLAELEEASDAQTKGAAPAEKGDKVDGEVQDTGAPVVDPEQKDAPAKKVAAKAKEVSSDAQQKGEGKPDKPEKLAAGFEAEGDKVIAEEPVEDEVLSDTIEDRIKDIDVAEDVKALMSSDDNLSEDFKTKAATIFEAAVKSKLRSEIERIQEEVLVEKAEELDTFKSELTEKVDTYLNYVVEEWTKENELAIERGLKGEIAEDFISGLKQLFEDHYIDVPDEKYDVLEAQSEKISELEEKVNSVMEQNVVLSTAKSGLVRERVISEVSEELADTEIEKFKSLTEDVDFTDEDSFREKCETLKESYFPKTVVEQKFDDEDGSTAQDVDTTDAMAAYLSAISRNQKASA
jgi:hypothetical protein